MCGTLNFRNLIFSSAPHYRNSDLLIAADCVAYSHGDFYRDYPKSRTLAIACHKLDANQETYLDKLTTLILGENRVEIEQIEAFGG